MRTIRSRAAVVAALADSHPVDRAVFRSLQHASAPVVVGDFVASTPQLRPHSIRQALDRLQRRGLVRRSPGGLRLPAVPLQPHPAVDHCQIPHCG
jgi:hypothetical protein